MQRVFLIFSFQFQKIKKDTEKITETDFRPNAIDQFKYLYIVLRKHGKGDNVWRSFALLLECYNHLNRTKVSQ